MLRRLVWLCAAAVVFVLGGVGITACYDLPRPDCGFVCGPGDACPDGYTCANDHRCHRNGAPPALMCSSPDAAVDAPIDAAIDAAIDAPLDTP